MRPNGENMKRPAPTIIEIHIKGDRGQGKTTTALAIGSFLKDQLGRDVRYDSSYSIENLPLPAREAFSKDIPILIVDRDESES